jgi:hypothetical protein
MKERIGVCTGRDVWLWSHEEVAGHVEERLGSTTSD